MTSIASTSNRPGRETRCGSITKELELQVGYLGPLQKVACISHKISWHVHESNQVNRKLTMLSRRRRQKSKYVCYTESLRRSGGSWIFFFLIKGGNKGTLIYRFVNKKGMQTCHLRKYISFKVPVIQVLP